MSSVTGSSARAIAAARGLASVITTLRPKPCAISTAGTCSSPPQTIRIASSGIATEIFGPLRIDFWNRAHVEPHVQDLAVDAGDDRMLAERQDGRVPVPDHDHIVDTLKIAVQTVATLQSPAGARFGVVQEHFLEARGKLRVGIEVVMRPRRPEAARVDRLTGPQALRRAV